MNGLLDVAATPEVVETIEHPAEMSEVCERITDPMTASVFQIAVETGQVVKAGDKLIVLDAMKTEIVVSSPSSGIIDEIRCEKGKLVHAGQSLLVLRAN